MVKVTKTRKPVSMKNFLRVAAMTCSTALLFACGGGGGGGTSGGSISGGGNTADSSAVFATNAGSAAIGAAMSNASISIQPLPASSYAEILLTANDSGAFTVPAGTAFPALVKATSANKQYTYYGYISSASQVGVPANPISTTLLTLAAGGHPSSITTAISDSDLSNARAKTVTVFQSLLSAAGQSNVTDFLSKTFTTDHTGLDLVLDSVGVQLSSDGRLVVFNKFNGVATTVDATNVTSIPFDTAAIQKMNGLPIQLCANFLNGLTSQSLTSNLTIYDSNFLESGRSRDIFISEIMQTLTSEFKISMPIFAGLDGNNNLKFNIQLGNSANNEYISDYGLTVKRDASSGKCVLIGDQFPFEITIQPAIKTIVRVDDLTSNVLNKFSGLEIYVGAHNNWNFAINNIGSNRIKSARVDVCDASNACSNLARLTNPNGGERTILDIDGPDAKNDLRMLPVSNFNLFTNISNPIKITFFSSSAAPLNGDENSIGVIFTRVTAPVFSAAEISAIEMPSVINPTLLKNAINNPIIQWNSGSGVISGLEMSSSNFSGQTNNDWKMLLKKGSGSTNLNVVDPSNTAFRKISLAAHIPNRPGMLETKYIWAPTCPSCN